MYPTYPYNMLPQQRQEIVHVNGENGARAFQLPPNSNALLLDDNSPIVYLVSTDGAGYKTINPYTITPYQPEPMPDYRSLEERISKLEGAINNGKSNTFNAQQKDERRANSESQHH